MEGIAVGLATVLMLGAAGCAAAAWRGRLRQGVAVDAPGASASPDATPAPNLGFAGSEAGWLRAADATTLL